MALKSPSILPSKTCMKPVIISVFKTTLWVYAAVNCFSSALCSAVCGCISVDMSASMLNHSTLVFCVLALVLNLWALVLTVVCS